MSANPYFRWMIEDNSDCFPVMAGDVLLGVLATVDLQVRAALGSGPKPVITALDLEGLQVVDYAGLKGVDAAQAATIRKFQREWPIRADEMLLLGLRSVIQFGWPEPQSESDIRFASEFDFVLKHVLTMRTGELSDQFSSMEGLLPYWGRLAFLRVMADLPEENVARFGLDKVAVALVKKAKFNARIWVFDGGSVITLNYALEPILKQLNRFLMHFFSTRDMAGPKRLSRAWQGIVPIVQHFWSDVAAEKLLGPTLTLYGENTVAAVHALTSDQLAFIVGHELGHVALDHPTRYLSVREQFGDATVVRHEFEFGADAFSLGLMRSRLMKRMKASVERSQREPAVSSNSAITSELRDYQGGLGAVYVLFTYMDFIQRAGELLRSKLGERVSFAERMDTHPRAGDRLNQLELINAGEYLYTSPIERYARVLFSDILQYAATLTDQALFESLQ